MAATASAAGALYLSAPKVAITSALTTTNPSSDRKNYKITWPGSPAINACLSFNDPITVQDNAGGSYHSLVAGTDYILDRLGGHIAFNTQLGVGVGVRVSGGYYLPLRPFMNCKEYDLTIDRKNYDVTPLWATATQRVQGSLIDTKGTMTNFYDPNLVDGDVTKDGDVTQIYNPNTVGSNQYFAEQPLSETWIIAQFWLVAAAPTGPSLMAWAKVSEEAIKSIVGDVSTETVQWEGAMDADGHMLYVEGLLNVAHENWT